MRAFVDLAGLASVDPGRVADALGLEGERVPASERAALLSRLVEGAGVVVVTGPLGAPYWSAVSPEVVVRVEPDGYDYAERNPIESDNGLAWSLHAAGLSPSGVTALLRGRTRPPTRRHALAPLWDEAARLRADLLVRCEGVTPLIEEAFELTVITDPEEQVAFVTKLDEFCALDWEWDPVDPSQVDGLSVATRTATTYLPVRAQDFRLPAGHGMRLRRVLSDKLWGGLPCVFHGGRADLSYQYIRDPAELSGRPIHDTLIMGYLADPDADDLGLKPLTRKWLGREATDYPGALSEKPLLLGARYAGADTRNTFDLFLVLARELQLKNQWGVYTRFEQPLMPIIASMEMMGQPVDVDALRALRDSHVEDETAIRDAVQVAYGYDLSNDECTKDWLGTITGFRPTKLDQRGISKWEQGEVDVILQYRQTRTRRRSFLDPALRRWEERGCPEDFRLYPKFNQAGKDEANGTVGRAPRTGRLSSSGSRRKWERAYGAPNFQNQPRSTRAMFVAPPGMRFGSIDYSAMELRIAAGVSGDPTMLAALNNGDDLHDLFRRKILELTGIDVGRVAAKSGNFEQLYGGRAAMLVRIMRKMRAHISLETAEAIVRGHEYAFPVYHQWARQVLALARERGYAETLFGRRRYLPGLYSADSDIRGNAERAAVNHVIQGTAADIVKLAMVRLMPVFARYGAHLAIQVHDEIDYWVPATVVDTCDGRGCEHAFCNEVLEVMTSIEIPGIKLTVAGGVGMSWNEVH